MTKIRLDFIAVRINEMSEKKKKNSHTCSDFRQAGIYKASCFSVTCPGLEKST